MDFTIVLTFLSLDWKDIMEILLTKYTEYIEKRSTEFDNNSISARMEKLEQSYVKQDTKELLRCFVYSQDQEQKDFSFSFPLNFPPPMNNR
jgi:hypothetical protein